MNYELRTIIHPIVMQLTKLRVNYKVSTVGTLPPLTEGPFLFSVNHTNSYDIPVTCRAIRRHSYVLIGKQTLYLTDRLFFFLNGTIWVDRKDKADMRIAKERIINHLKKGKSLIWYPEGTWNMTENLPMLPMKWGIIECAQKTNTTIIPIVQEYDKESKTVKCKIGEKYDPGEASLSEGIVRLRDTMSGMRWELWEEKGLKKRSDIDVLQEIEDIYITQLRNIILLISTMRKAWFLIHIDAVKQEI